MNYTIDASVFVAAARAEEKQYAVSLAFLKQAQEQGVDVFCPALVLPECSAAIARRTGLPALAEKLVLLIESFAGLRLIALSLPLARRAAQIAAAHRLRGADSVYTAVAEECAATLVTWDAEMLQRSSAVVPTITPTDWIAGQKAKMQATE